MLNEEWSAADLKRALSLRQASQQIRGFTGKPVSYRSLLNWADPDIGYKVRSRPAVRIVLRTFRLGNELLTFPEWLQEFERARLMAGLREPIHASESA